MRFLLAAVLAVTGLLSVSFGTYSGTPGGAAVGGSHLADEGDGGFEWG